MTTPRRVPLNAIDKPLGSLETMTVEVSPSGRVHVGDHGFGVLDKGEIPIETVDYSNGLLAPMSVGAMVCTGIDTGYVRVRVVIRAGPPEEIDEDGDVPWEEIVEADVYAPCGQLRVDSLPHGPVADLPVLSAAGPGRYRVRAHARGRDTAFDMVQDDVEDYLLVVWPTQGEADSLTIRATDQCGWGLRACVRKPSGA